MTSPPVNPGRTDERALVEYLLGRLEEPQRNLIDERIVTEESFEEELLATADDLIDAYLKGALSAEDRTLFESHFLAIPRHQRRLEFLRDLGSAIEQTPRAGGAEAQQRSASIPGVPTRQRREPSLLWSGLAAAAALVAIASSFWLGPGPRQPSRAPGSGAAAVLAGPSIAVLPFVDASPTQNQEYLADGLWDELLSAFAKVPRLRVAARTSSFQFKGRTDDVRVIGQRLGVDAILQGTVRREDDRLRISARLIKVSDGSELWSQTFDSDMNQIPALRNDIARAVSRALNLTRSDTSRLPSDARGSANVQNLYFQGRYYAARRTPDQIKLAIESYDQALQLEPNYAPAWVGLAEAHERLAGRNSIPAAEGYERARREVEKALALDPQLADAHAVLGSIKRSRDWDWAGAAAACHRALELEPWNERALRCAARAASTLGRFEEAIEIYRRALQLDPLNVNVYTIMAPTLWNLARLDDAEASFRKVLELNPNYVNGHWGLGLMLLGRGQPTAALAEMEQEAESAYRRQGLAMAYAALGRRTEADAALAELIRRDAERFAIQIAIVYAFRGETEKAFEWLDRAYAQHDSGLADLKGSIFFKPMEADPRFKALLQKLGLPP